MEVPLPPMYYVPSLPLQYVPDFSPTSTTLESAIFRSFDDQGNAHVVVGMSGTGKTSALLAVGSHCDVMSKFSEAIWFLSVAKGVGIIKFVKSLEAIVQSVVGKAAADGVALLSLNAEYAAASLKAITLLNSSPVLLLFDDLSSSPVREDSQPTVFSLVKESLRFVLRVPAILQIVTTTRDDAVADLVPCRLCIHSSPLPSRATESKSILCSYAGVKVDELEDAAQGATDGFIGVLDRCAGLQLALSIAGIAIQDMVKNRLVSPAVVWERYEADLEKASTLSSDPTPDHHGLSVMIKSSLGTVVEMAKDNPVLSKQDVHLLFRSFSVFQKQQRIPCLILECMWGLEASYVYQVCKFFSNLHLVSLEDENGTYVVYLHDLIHDFCLHESETAGILVSMHISLLDRMYANLKQNREDQVGSQSDREWWLPPVEDRGGAFQRYLTERVTWHLKEGRCLTEYLALLIDYRWAECRILNGANGNEVTGICADIDSFVASYSSNMSEDLREGLRLISSAFKLSASYISMNNGEIPFQLSGRLISFCESNTAVNQFFESLARHAQAPWVLPGEGVLKPPGGFTIFEGSIHESVKSIALLPGEMEIIIGTMQGTVKFFSFHSRKVVHQIQAHSKPVAVDVSEKEDLIATACSDGELRLWNLSFSSELESSPIVTDVRISCIAFAKNGLEICIGGSDGSVQIWQLRTGTMKWMGPKSMQRISALVVLDEENTVVSCSERGELHWRDLDSGEERRTPSILAKEQVYLFSINSDRSLYVVVSGMRISAHNINTDAVVATFLARYETADIAPSSMNCSPTEPNMVFFGDLLGTIRVWNIENGSTTLTINAHSDAVMGIRFRSNDKFEDGAEIVTAAVDGSISIHQIDESKIGRHEREEVHRVADVAPLPHSNYFLFCLKVYKPLYVHDMTKRFNGAKMVKLQDHGVCALKCTPDGSLVTLGTWTGDILLMNTEDWQLRSPILTAHSTPITRLDVSADNSLLAAGCDGGMVSLWMLPGGTRIPLDSAEGEGEVRILKCMVECNGMVAIFKNDVTRIWTWDSSPLIHKVETFSGEEVIGGPATLRMSIIANETHVLLRGEEENCFRLFDFRTGEQRKLAEDESDECGLISIMRARYEKKRRDGELSVEPFRSQLVYSTGSIRTVLGTLGERFDFNFDADNWKFDKSTGFFLAGCKLKPLLAANLVSEKGKSPAFSFKELQTISNENEREDDEELEGNEMYSVFVSHAGNDKFDIAIPLYYELRRRGVHSFVDKKELRPGEDAPAKMVRAMKTARIGVFILSPEFAARRWPVRELTCFLDRYRKKDDRTILIPVFYRLTVHECRKNDLYNWKKTDGSSLFLEEGFFKPERQAEASTNDVMMRMNAITTFNGIKNEDSAKNASEDPSPDGALKRQKLIERIADAVEEAIARMDRAQQSDETGKRSLCLIA